MLNESDIQGMHGSHVGTEGVPSLPSFSSSSPSPPSALKLVEYEVLAYPNNASTGEYQQIASDGRPETEAAGNVSSGEYNLGLDVVLGDTSTEDWTVHAKVNDLPKYDIGLIDSLLVPQVQYGDICNSTQLVVFNWTTNQTMLVNCSNGTNGDDIPDIVYKHPVLGAVLTFFAITTVIGNILVIAAVGRERYLRTVTNYFIVSLALADLIIGAVVMPFSISLEMTNQFWLFGSDWCDVWHSFDVLASTASILNLSVIALDRYWAITDPIAYPSKMSTGRAFVLIALVWICSAAISFPAILWWRAVSIQPPPKDVCFFTEDTGYLIFSSIISFCVPVIIILFAYYKIYLAASEQTRSLKTGTKVMCADSVNGEVMTLRMHRGVKRPNSDVHYSRAANSDSENDSPQHLLRHSNNHLHVDDDVRPSRMISRKWKHFALSRKISKLAKEQKAAKTLGIVMGIFCMCWVPFFVTNVLFGICNTKCVKHADVIFPVFTWLGYINSGMNPVIYACSMRDFRRAFTKIIFCCCPTYRFRNRRRNYDISLSNTSFVTTCGGAERCANIRL